MKFANVKRKKVCVLQFVNFTSLTRLYQQHPEAIRQFTDLPYVNNSFIKEKDRLISGIASAIAWTRMAFPTFRLKKPSRGATGLFIANRDSIKLNFLKNKKSFMRNTYNYLRVESRLAMNSSVAPREGFFSRNVGTSMRVYSIAEAM